ncbi:MAG: citramalate synthase [Lentisphaerae bacterium]|jgi:2-isopropylmalate synthase|nr:citramalate synthase [Lentisphaerota bacterium]
MSNGERVDIYDSTLRDGAQAVGITFSQSGKMRFVHKLDEFGVSFIEAGYPGSNPKDMQFFEDLRKEKLSTSKIVGFGSTRRANTDVADDTFIHALLKAETEFCAIYGKTWKLHVTDVLRTTYEENGQMIADTVGYLRENGRRVFFDAEHFFSGYKDDAEFALKMLGYAVDAGAEALVLCDTIGGALPWEVEEATRVVRETFPGVIVGIHAHNDCGLGAANSIAAVRAGALQVQGCMNGYGERTGNANLTTIMPTLELKMGRKCIAEGKLSSLSSLSLYVDDLVNQRPDIRAPFVGETAFSHKGGAHVAGVQRNPLSFEHITPESVGNSRQIILSELAGGANVVHRLRQLGREYDNVTKEEVREILAELKVREGDGYTFESADGSFKLLAQKALNKHKPFFNLDSFRVIIEKRGENKICMSEATVKLNVNGETEHTVGEAEGPVEALDIALRKALARFYPTISDVTLSDFRVRILDPKDATAATTRVLIESTDGSKSWGTVGVSPNIIEASWQALLDSVEYKLLLDEENQG